MVQQQQISTFTKEQEDRLRDLLQGGRGIEQQPLFQQGSQFLQQLFGRRIDLVTPNSLSPYLAPYIMKEVEYIEELS